MCAVRLPLTDSRGISRTSEKGLIPKTRFVASPGWMVFVVRFMQVFVVSVARASAFGGLKWMPETSASQRGEATYADFSERFRAEGRKPHARYAAMFGQGQARWLWPTFQVTEIGQAGHAVAARSIFLGRWTSRDRSFSWTGRWVTGISPIPEPLIREDLRARRSGEAKSG